MRDPLRRAIATAPALACLWLPRAAEACYVCMAGRDEATRFAFVATTGLLTFLPMALVGGLVWWLRRRARQLETEASEDDASGAAAFSRTSSSP